jgi:chromosome segregation ATPase
MQIEATLLMTEGLHSQLQEEMKTLTQDFDRSTKKLSELENNKIDLESTLKELKLVNTENATLHENQQSLARISDHESELMTLKTEQENVERKVHMIE